MRRSFLDSFRFRNGQHKTSLVGRLGHAAATRHVQLVSELPINAVTRVLRGSKSQVLKQQHETLQVPPAFAIVGASRGVKCVLRASVTVY